LPFDATILLMQEEDWPFSDALLLPLTGIWLLIELLIVFRVRPRFEGIRQRAVDLVAVAAILPLAACVGWTYWRTIAPLPDLVKLPPTPNAYDEIIRLTPSWADKSLPNRPGASPSLMRVFAEENQQDLDSLRAAIALPGTVVLLNESEGALREVIDETRAIRNLQLALRASADGQQDVQQAAIGRDLLRLGDRASNGGIFLHRAVASLITQDGIKLIHRTRRQLERDQLLSLIKEITQLEGHMESGDAVADRDRNWAIKTSDWPIRVVLAAIDFSGAESTSEIAQQMQSIIAMDLALLRLLRVELALHAFRRDHGKLPATLTELMPALLDAIPIDPFSNQPLLYRPKGDEFELYSVGVDGRDDNGAEGSPFTGGRGDLNLDMLERRPIPTK
jgi:hypothetical protein